MEHFHRPKHCCAKEFGAFFCAFVDGGKEISTFFGAEKAEHDGGEDDTADEDDEKGIAVENGRSGICPTRSIRDSGREKRHQQPRFRIG